MAINDRMVTILISDDGVVVKTGECGRLAFEKDGTGKNMILYPYAVVQRLKSTGEVVGTTVRKKIRLCDIPAVTEVQSVEIVPAILDDNGNEITPAEYEDQDVIIVAAQNNFTTWYDYRLLSALGEGTWGDLPISTFTTDTSMTLSTLLSSILGAAYDTGLGAVIEGALAQWIATYEVI